MSGPAWSMFDLIVNASRKRGGLSVPQGVAHARMWLERALDDLPSEDRARERERMMRAHFTDEQAATLIAKMIESPESLAIALGMSAEHIRRLTSEAPTPRDMARYASLLYHAHGLGAPESPQSFTREAVSELGRVIFEHILAGAPDPSSDDAWLRPMQMNPQNEAMWSVCNARDTRMLATAAARWYEQACPVVQLASHTYAAALAATSVPQGVDIRPPWRSFMIDLPNGLVPSDDGDVRALLVHQHTMVPTRDPVWSIGLLPRNGNTLLRTENRPLEDLVDGEVLGADDAFDGLDLPSDLDLLPQDGRRLRVCARIALGVCLAMSDPDIARTTVSSRGGPNRRNGRFPTCRVFLLGHPVKIDVRAAVHDYVLHGRSGRGPLTMQFLVRGHWRNQACGPHLGERRSTWIEPHWKGPEDGPINVRTRILEPQS